MITRIEPTAPNTIKFLKYAVERLIERQPLEKGKLIKIRIQDGATPFPEFTENLLDGDDGIKIIDKIEDVDRNVADKLVQLKYYLDDTLKYHTATQMPIPENPDPLTLTIPFIVVDGDGLLKFASELGTENRTPSGEHSPTISISSRALPEVFYYPKTGIGFVDNRRFKFKNDQPEFAVFAEMYERIGNPITRKRILELSRYQEKKPSISNDLLKNMGVKNLAHTLTTYFINELTKKIRKRTGLSVDHLVNNNGEMTLMAGKMGIAPK